MNRYRHDHKVLTSYCTVPVDCILRIYIVGNSSEFDKKLILIPLSYTALKGHDALYHDLLFRQFSG